MLQFFSLSLLQSAIFALIIDCVFNLKSLSYFFNSLWLPLNWNRIEDLSGVVKSDSISLFGDMKDGDALRLSDN